MPLQWSHWIPCCYSHKPCIAITDLYYTDWIEGHALTMKPLDTMLLLSQTMYCNHWSLLYWLDRGSCLTMKPLDTMLLLSQTNCNHWSLLYWLDRGSCPYNHWIPCCYSHKPCIAITDLYYIDWIEGHALTMKPLDTMLLLSQTMYCNHWSLLYWLDRGSCLTMKPLDTMLLLS